MKEGKTFKNFAFISYSHADKKAAEELQKVLDEFQLSDALKEKYPNRPEVLREIFRDDTGLPAGSNLTKEIQKQLEQSNYLIVICSPNAAKSEWVNKEIDYFKTHRDSTHIIPFIIDGVANAKNANDQECFPTALKSLEARGANISTFSFERAVIEVIAGALEIDVDDLWQRHVRAAEAKKRQLQEQRDNLLRVQSRFLAEKANALVDEGDSYTARLLALEALPKDLENPERPFVPESEIALRNACEKEDCILRGSDVFYEALFSPDGKLIFGSCADGNVYCWDAYTGGLYKTISTRYNFVSSLHISNNGDRMVILGGHITSGISLIDVKAGKSLWEQSAGVFGGIGTVSFNRCGSLIVVANNRKEFPIIDVKTGKIVHVLRGHNDCVVSAKFSYDGKKIVSGSRDKTVCVWNAENGICKHIFEGHKEPILSVSFNHENTQVVSVSYDGTARLWNLKEQKCCEIFHSSSSFYMDAIFSLDDKLLILSSGNGIIEVLDIKKGVCIKKFERHNGYVKSLFLSPDGKKIVSASSDNTVRVWELFKEDKPIVLMGHKRWLDRVFFLHGEKLAVTTSDIIRIWDVETSKIVDEIKDVVNISGCTVSPNGEYIAYGEDRYPNYYLNVRHVYSNSTHLRIELGFGDIGFLSFSQNARYIAVGTGNGKIGVFDVCDGKQICLISLYHSNGVHSLSFHSDKNTLLAVSDEDNMMAFDFRSGKLVNNYFSNEDLSIKYAEFSPDGNIIAAAWNHLIYLLDSKNGEVLCTLEGHNSHIHTVKFSVDGLHLVSTSDDKTVRVWDVSTGTCVGVLNGHMDHVLCASWNHVGDKIISGSSDKTARIWCFPSISMLQKKTITRFNSRQLTPEERKKYYLD
jgi:WD40 repeat protein